MKENLTFHKGIDYAVVMRPKQTTEDALARLYGEDRHVTKFGKLFAASTDLLAAAKIVLAGLHLRIDTATAAGLPVPVFDGIYDLHDAIAKAEGPTP